MHDDDLDQILRVIDTPGPVPDKFKSDLLVDLREAFDAPRLETNDHTPPVLAEHLEQPLDDADTDGIVVLPLERPNDVRALGPKLLIAAAAVAVLVVGLLVAVPDDSPLEVTDDPAPSTSTALQSLSIEEACAEFLESTTPLAELYTIDDPELFQSELEMWRSAIDRLLDRSPPELTDDLTNDLLHARVLIRQAMDSAAPSTITALETHWRAITTDLPLSHCRR